MDRNFALLGLRDDATREQVKAAYERRLSKYRSADYADDPEYARRKIGQLKAAYEKAYQAAGKNTGSLSAEESFARPLTPSEKNEEKRASADKKKKTQKYRSQIRRMEEEERHPLDLLRIDRKERDREAKKSGTKGFGLTKPDLSELKNKARELRENVSDNLKGSGIASGEDTGEHSDLRGNTERTERPQIEQRLDSNGQIVKVDTRSENKSGEQDNKKNSQTAGAIISAAVTLIIFAFTMCGNDVDVTYYDDEDYITYSYEDYTDEDRAVCEQGWKIEELLYNGELAYSDYWEYSEAENYEDLEKAANRFAKRYTGSDSMEALSDRLYAEVGSYSASGGDNLEYQVEQVLIYYEFPSLDTMCGYINPYNEEPIENLTGYLKFLNKYYLENFA